MASKVNYFKIGIFVISSIVVLIIFIIVLGLGSIGKTQMKFETYIDESVQGLSVGSPVKHRGVQVGRVEAITFVTSEYDLNDSFVKYSRYVMVVVAAEEGKFDSYKKQESMLSILDELIDKGLRIRLTTQALTGIAYLEVDYFNPKDFPVMEIGWKPKYTYIPSAPSAFGSFTQSLDQTLKQIANVDIVQTMKNFNDLLISVNTTIQDAEIVALVDELRETNQDVKNLLAKTSAAVDQANVSMLSEKLDKLITDFNTAATTATGAITGLNDTNLLVQNMLKESSQTTTTIPELITSLDAAVNQINSLVNENRTDIQSIITKLHDTATNLTDFSNNLKQNPGIILFSEQPEPSEIIK